MEKKEELIIRIKVFVKRVFILVYNLPDSKPANAVANQILRSSTSIGANYRAACRSKSRKDFINKLKIVEEETDETLYWLELIGENEIIRPEKIAALQKEGDELLSIFVASLKTAKKNEGITQSTKNSRHNPIVNRKP